MTRGKDPKKISKKSVCADHDGCVLRATAVVVCLLTISLPCVSVSSTTIQHHIGHYKLALLPHGPTHQHSVDIVVLRGGSRDGQKRKPGDWKANNRPQTGIQELRLMKGLSSLGSAYGSLLQKHPILTKSVTSGFMFGCSDWLAQRLQASSTADVMTDWPRIQTIALVGLLFFGPAAHVWLDLMFHLFPGTSIASTLAKSCLGQLVFGPSLVCIMFAASLLQQGSFSMTAYSDKIRRDLPGVWISGLNFFPVANYVGYSMVPKDYMPLFQNCCSLIFNVYLSLVTYRRGVTR